MGDGKHCPGCGGDIGLWPVFSAGRPDWIRCRQCSARLRYRDTAGVLAIIVVVAVAGAVGCYLAAAELVSDGPRRGVTFVGLLLAAWVPLELGVAWYLRNYKQLVRADEPKAQSPRRGGGKK
jgi:hypothetical protein